ncbi:DDE transposase family protein [Legionella longbeachae]|uniref:DDE transposase family protein n=1 Tax=Legionella longbeachae TaxID=450 RepID=UPI0001BEC59A|nr:DDE transposase family protein [Legionella longbeachae]VEE03779.1 Uncharacterised protein [Legionella oakridgensis]HBD7397419.1 DDE transposase family protein [Legionella pneumophila]ARB93346.1 DDE transposase family protein [Legionella longbeachae]ARM33550.1 DDE transposase family protein [Legionella longbeachae]EEZ93589.1 hypothetical protein LLB_2481 [Legionella longbeachae D-4968]
MKRYLLIKIMFLLLVLQFMDVKAGTIRDFGLLKIEWLKQFLTYKNGMPVDDTMTRDEKAVY